MAMSILDMSNALRKGDGLGPVDASNLICHYTNQRDENTQLRSELKEMRNEVRALIQILALVFPAAQGHWSKYK